MLNYLFNALKEFLLLLCTTIKYIFALFAFKSTSKKCQKIQVNHTNEKEKKNPIKHLNELKHKTLNFSRKKKIARRKLDSHYQNINKKN
jgi:hypothetical protein